MFNGKLLYMKYFGIPRLQDILFLGIFSAVVLLGPSLLNTDGDLPRHIAMGRYIIQSGQIPITDVFSHTAYGINFAPHEWLSGVIFSYSILFLALTGSSFSQQLYLLQPLHLFIPKVSNAQA